MGKLVMAEQRRGHAALPAPLVALLRDHRVAEDRPQHIDLQLALGELCWTFEEQGLDELAAGDERHSRGARRDDERLAVRLLGNDGKIVGQKPGKIERKSKRLRGRLDMNWIKRF